MEYDQAEAKVASTVRFGDSPMKPSQVGDAVGEQSAVLDELHETITRLESKLSPVLRESQASDADSHPEPVLVPLAAQLRTHAGSTRYAVVRLQDLIERVEL